MSRDTQDIDQAVAPLLDGRLSRSESEAAVDVIIPSNGQRCSSIPAGCEADAGRTVAAASAPSRKHAAARRRRPSERETLYRGADLITARAVVPNALDAGGMGKHAAKRSVSLRRAAGVMRSFNHA